MFSKTVLVDDAVIDGVPVAAALLPDQKSVRFSATMGASGGPVVAFALRVHDLAMNAHVVTRLTEGGPVLICECAARVFLTVALSHDANVCFRAPVVRSYGAGTSGGCCCLLGEQQLVHLFQAW